MNKKFKKYGLIIILSILVYLVIISPHLILNKPLVNGVDVLKQSYMFESTFDKVITGIFSSGKINFYDWNMFLGNNIYASKTFFGLFDIYSVIGNLFLNMDYLAKTLILFGLKFVVASVTMVALLSKIGIKDRYSIFGGLLYSLSAYLILFSEQQFFISFYSLAPLLLLVIEHFLQNNRKLPLIFCVFFLFIDNYYFMITLSIFAFFYYIFRYYVLKESFKGIIKKSILFLSLYFIGIFLSAIVLVPSLLYILGNSRVGSGSNLGLIYDLRILINNMLSLLVPTYLYNSLWNYDLMFDLPYAIKQCFLFIGTGSLFLLIQHFSIKNKENKANMLFLVFNIVFFIFPLLTSAIHGFSEPSFRWTYITIMFFIIFICQFLSSDNVNININLLKKTVIIYILLVVAGFFALMGYINDFSFTTNQYNYALLFISIIWAIVFYFLLKKREKFEIIFLILSIIQLTSFATFQFYKEINMDENGTYEFIDKATHVLEDKRGDLSGYLDSLSPDQYYRVYVDYNKLYWNLSQNMSLIYQINGLMAYDSTYSPSWNQMNLIMNKEDYHEILIDDPILMEFLNTRYAIVVDEADLPVGIQWNLINDNYRWLKVYENMQFRPLIQLYSKINSISNCKVDNCVTKILDTVISEEDNYEEIKSFLNEGTITVDYVNYENNSLFTQFNSTTDGFAILTLPYDEGWNIINNGIKKKPFKVNGGFIGIPIDKGDNYLEMYFTPKGFKLGAILSGLGLLLTFSIGVMEFIRKRKSNN